MKCEITSPTEIRLTPETQLEDDIARNAAWNAAIEAPKPLQLNQHALVLTGVRRSDTRTGTSEGSPS